MKSDSESYLKKKSFLKNILTIFGRKPVLEILDDPNITIHKIHLSDSNKPADILTKIITKAEKKGIEVCFHSKIALSRISKNSKQDQGVAADIILKGFIELDNFIKTNKQKPYRLLALDSVTNPQNVGMIIRSACASFIDGLLIPEKGCAKLDALVIKASAGTLFRAPIIRSNSLPKSLNELKKNGAQIIGLDASSNIGLSDLDTTNAKVYVLGNETSGLSEETQRLCTHKIGIKMNNQVESLNVAVTASLIAFHGSL